MAVTAKLYGNVLAKAFNKEIDLDADAIHVTLHTSTYIPDQDVHDYYNDLTNEVSGTGYTAGGMALTTKTVTYTAGTNTFTFDADDLTWANSTITARYAVIRDSQTGVAASSPLIAYVDFGQDISSTSGPFTITWDAGGIFTVTAAA